MAWRDLVSLGVGGTWVALAACAGVMELQWTCLRLFTGGWSCGFLVVINGSYPLVRVRCFSGRGGCRLSGGVRILGGYGGNVSTFG